MRHLLTLCLGLSLFGCAPLHQQSQGINAEFRYMADAAMIQLCETGQRYPVAMEKAYIELERAYLASGVDAGKPAGVSVTGSVQPRPAMEGDQLVQTYVVEAFHSIFPGQLCPNIPQPVIK